MNINPTWQGRVRESAERFNRYVDRHSARLVSDLVEDLLNLLESSKIDSIYRFDVAQLLKEIRDNNPGVIMYQNSEKIDKILWGNGTPQEIPQSNGSQYEDYSGEESKNLVAIPPMKSAGTKKQPNLWVENDFAGDSEAPPDSVSPEAVIQVPLEQLSLKNVMRVSMKPEFTKRKCALGDGEFEDYEGFLWECGCGTLYHPECLKLQVMLVGACHICSRPFRNVK